MTWEYCKTTKKHYVTLNLSSCDNIELSHYVGDPVIRIEVEDEDAAAAQHLTPDRARQLGHILVHWANTGKLPYHFPDVTKKVDP